jgi:hypothetical protein
MDADLERIAREARKLRKSLKYDELDFEEKRLINIVFRKISFSDKHSEELSKSILEKTNYTRRDFYGDN